ncbi:DUF418 domain-containing protein [Labilibacter sediminis]|nr:DUF418 domain-containing protein [Labilibacter sediminis]
MTAQVAPKKNRIEVVDFIRGFAIMAIMLLHNIERFNLYVFPGGMKGMSGLDRGIWDTLFFMFGGKTYSIFALLFGFTFFVQYTGAKCRGQNFDGRYLWRLLLLAGLACINAAFFPGEVLMLYAVVGVVLYLFRKASNTWVLVAATVFMLQPVELFYYFKDLLDSSFELPAQLSRQLHGGVKEYVNEGTFWALVKGNTTIGQAWSMMWAIENGRFLQTAGLFLMGMFIGRKQWYADKPENRKVWWRILISGFITAVIFYFLRDAYYLNRDFEFRRSIGVAIDMWWKVSCTFIWVSIFVLLYKTQVFKKITKPFLSYGKMSLTNYITQSIIGSLLYFPFAMNLAPKITVTESLLLGVVLFVMQIAFCNWWIKKYKQGPFEKLWHRLTWINSDKQ